MKYAIQINASPWDSTWPLHACQFIKALVGSGHQVVRVFFYHEGVHNAFAQPEHSHTPLPDWYSLAADDAIELIYCSAAAERRGLLSSAHQPGFQAGGLGIWVDGLLQADRSLVFG